MSTTILADQTRETKSFDTTIHVAGVEVMADQRGGNTLLVSIDLGDGIRSFTPAEACALAAALQAVAVYQMEQQPREIRRSTEPGAPAFEEAI